MAISQEYIQNVKNLATQTGAGMGICKQILDKHEGDFNKAKIELEKYQGTKAQSKSEKETNEGIIDIYSHGSDKRVGVMVEARCQTSFAAKTENFRNLIHEISLQVAAMNPKYVSSQEIPQEEIDKLKKKIEEESDLSKKPAEIKDKIIQGKLDKIFSEKCLLEQEYFRDSNMKIKDLITKQIATIGENIKIIRFIRWQVME